MLVAQGPDGRPVVAGEMPLEQLQRWSREHALRCPNCRGIVHVRGGPQKRMQLHFAHQKGECAWSTETESVRHARGKMVLANWLRKQFPQATISLEERLPEPNRIADIFVTHASGELWAIEFQCAPLDVDEWQRRHAAYRNAQILDIWIIGSNRREKQEAFIEAIIRARQEVMFLDPLVTPPRIWLRWPVSEHTLQVWQSAIPGAAFPAAAAPRFPHFHYGVTLSGRLQDVRLTEQGRLFHAERAALEARARLLQTMSMAPSIDEAMLADYLRGRISEEALHKVILPLLRAYLRDPELMRRYNYGRGQAGLPASEADTLRVQKARQWIRSLAGQGFPLATLQELLKELPFVGPYASFRGYMEMLLTIS